MPIVLGPAVPWEDADAVAVADVDGDGSQERYRVEGGVLHGPHGAHTLDGTWQKAVARERPEASSDDTLAPIPEELIFATGTGRTHPDAPVRVYQTAGEAPSLLWERDGSRDQLTDLRVVGPRVWAAVFEGKWQVAGGWLDAEGFDEVSRARMAMTQLPLADGSVVQGRLYGDAPKSDGSLVLHLQSGEERTLPSKRGVRSLAVGDVDADGDNDVLVADGWHYAYGDRGLAHLAVYPGPDFTEPRTLTLLPDDYTINAIDVVSIGRSPVILLSGSDTVQIAWQDALGWRLSHVADIHETDHAVFRVTEHGVSVLVSGDPAVERTVSLGVAP